MLSDARNHVLFCCLCVSPTKGGYTGWSEAQKKAAAVDLNHFILSKVRSVCACSSPWPARSESLAHLQVIGRGSFGKVYLAKKKTMPRKVLRLFIAASWSIWMTTIIRVSVRKLCSCFAVACGVAGSIFRPQGAEQEDNHGNEPGTSNQSCNGVFAASIESVGHFGGC